MVSAAENYALTDVAPGKPMHLFWKRYWIPALRSQKLVAEGAPERVRLLGENYVAFRAKDGRIGFFSEYCPHRRASLVLARSEDCALRCIYHGWKIDVSGAVLETPNDPNPDFPKTVRVRPCPTHEAAGIVWVFLGEGPPPRFTDFVFTHLPPEQVWPRAAIVNSNWLQGLEGTVDPSHVAILHGNVTRAARALASIDLMSSVNAPRIETENRPYGMSVAALREAGGGKRYVRVGEWVAPGLAFIPYAPDEPQQCIICVPVDTDHTLQWNIFFHYQRPMTPAEREFMRYGTGLDDDNIYEARLDDPRWGQDRAAMRNGSHSGLPGVIVEDFVIAESMGAIPDRTVEYLCASDISVVRLRRLLLDGLARLAAGESLPGQDGSIAVANIRATAGVFGANEDWRKLGGNS